MEIAKQEQARLGYHPNGYDFFGFRIREYDGYCFAAWECAASCD